jgi:hypothetical protein
MSVTTSPGGPSDLDDFMRQHGDRITIPLPEFRKALEGWEIWNVRNNGRRVATVLRKGSEGHIARFANCKVGASCIKVAADILGITETAVTDGFRHGHALAKRIGFTVTKHENGVTHYASALHVQK